MSVQCVWLKKRKRHCHFNFDCISTKATKMSSALQSFVVRLTFCSDRGIIRQEVKIMNNLKQIRDIYGATQEQIAEALAVNRVTVANWESGNSTVSSGNREKLSIYYGIGPEYFYEKELDDVARQMLINSAEKAKSITEQFSGKKNKEDDFHRIFESLTFQEAMSRYMFSMKMLLATADNGELEKLKTASLINKKMGERLDAIIELRKREETSDEPSLFTLLNEETDN